MTTAAHAMPMSRSEQQRPTIGRLSLDAIFDSARRLEAAGGPRVPPNASRIEELGIAGPADITRLTQATAAGSGSILMSSGGTTGEPKLTFVPFGQAVERMIRTWRPLGPGNVLLNLFNPGRLWGSHYLMLALAEGVKCTVIPMGPILPTEMGSWIPTLRQVGTDSIAGTPTGIAEFCEALLSLGGTLPIRNVLWVGEPWSKSKENLVRAAFPEAVFWGMYGSIETFVIGSNTPDCPTDIFHLHPDEMLELDNEGALLTRVGEGWTVPIVRYRLGDRIAPAECPCGRHRGFTVLGRADDAFKFHGTLTSIGALLSFAKAQPGVDDAQLMISGSRQEGRAERIVVNVVGNADHQALRRDFITRFVDLDVKGRDGTDQFDVAAVERLQANARTFKVPPAIWMASGE